MDDQTIAQLRDLAKSSPEYEYFFNVLSAKDRNQAVTTIDNFLAACDKEKLGRNEQASAKLARDFFKELSQLNLGQLRIGRHGGKTRFLWSEALKHVAAAVGSNHTPENRNATNVVGIPATSNQEGLRIISHTYVLRENLLVSLALPIDFSSAEAERLSAFIKTLPLNQN